MRITSARDERGNWTLHSDGSVSLDWLPTRTRVTAAELRRWCLARLAVTEEFPPAIRPGYHLNKRHWNTITLDGSLPDEMVFEMLEDSYDLVAAGLPQAKRQAILAQMPERTA